jgi:hypothetical protein
MATHSKSVKFEISLEKLTVKFEGDLQVAERVQGEITNALNTLASAQNRMLAAPKAAAPVLDTGVNGGGHRRRRRRKTAGSGNGGIDPAILDGVAVDEEEESAGAETTESRRSSAGDQAALIGALKTSGFFSERRTLGAIRAELERRGHSFKSSDLSPTLVRLTRNETLQREKASNNQWVYYV